MSFKLIIEPDNGIDLEMITPSQFENGAVNDRRTRLLSPIVHDIMDLPKSRAIHINMLNSIEEENFESLSMLESFERDRMVVYNKATIPKPMGRLIIKKKPTTKYSMDMKKRFKNTRTVEANAKLVVGNRDLMVFNYKLIHMNYIYQQHKTRNYSMLVNSLSTMIDEINSKGEFQYNVIVLDTPKSFPTIPNLIKSTLKKVDNYVLGVMNNMDKLLILELWKIFFNKASSIFDKIHPDRRTNTYLAFTNNGKYTYYCLNDLIALSKTNKVKANRMKAVSELEAGKLFLLSIGKFIYNSVLPTDLLTGVVNNTDDEDEYIDLDESLSDMGFVVDDDEVEESTVEEVLTSTRDIPLKKSEFNKIASDAINNKEILNDKIEVSTRNKSISKSENTKLVETINSQLDEEFTIRGKSVKLGTILDYDNIDSKLVDIPMRSNATVLDENFLGNSNRTLDKEYLDKLYYKDLYNAIYSVQNADVVITKHDVEYAKSMLGEVEIHELHLKPLDGQPSVVRFPLPVIDPEDGTYRMSSNEYLLRYQRKDLPIRKTSPNDVLLTSYSGKLFISKNLYQKDDQSVWFSKHISNNDRFINIILKKTAPYDVELPLSYTLVSSSTSRFTYVYSSEATKDKKGIDFVFDYRVRLSIVEGDDLKTAREIESKYGYILIGRSNDRKSLYFMDNAGMIKLYNSNKITDKGDLEGFFQLDFRKMPNVSCSIRVLGKYIPLGLIMLDYVGIDKLLELLESKPVIVNIGDTYKLGRDEFKLELEDKILIFKRDDYKASLIFYGLPKEILSIMKYDELNDKDALSVIYNLYNLGIAQINAISDIESTFLDNITKDKLKNMGEPTDIHRLLIRAVEMLVDDNYKNPNNIMDNEIVRYERIPGLVNKSLIRALSSYKNRNTLSKAKIKLDPYEIWRAIGDDSTSMLVENNNPIATIKQRDNVTYLGEFGRSRITMTLPSRVMTPDEVGIISEATPDSGDSGISTYLTHNASIDSLRGVVKPIDISKYTINKALSSANVINPFITNDSPNRMNFASTQSSHFIPMVNMKSQRIWTGAESTIASKVGKPFVYTALSSGSVTKLSKDAITIKYSTPKEGNDVLLLSSIDDSKLIRDVYDIISDKGYKVVTDSKVDCKYTVYIGDDNPNKKYINIKDDKYLLSNLSGIKKADTIDKVVNYSLRPWSAKVEGGSSIRHTMDTMLKLYDKVSIDDVITYDNSFFEPNIYDKKSIVLKMGTRALVALVDFKITLEDSVVLNSNILDKTGEVRYTVLSKVLDTNSHITNVIPEGSKVEYNDKLMTIIDSALVNDSSLSDRAREILSDINDRSPKANANGIIDRIDVFYNCELEDMDDSLRQLALKSNKRFKDERDVSGRVTSEYSINGKPLLKGEIELKYYISNTAPSEIGDKFVIGHQLKCTVGDVYDTIETEDGNSVDALFGNRSILGRIVNSPYEMGVVNTAWKHFSDNAIKAYKGD